MENKLKLCPFCGGEAEIHTRFDSLDTIVYKKSEIPKDARFMYEKKVPNHRKYYVYKRMLYIPQCLVTHCVGRSQRYFYTEDEAIEAWNRRGWQ